MMEPIYKYSDYRKYLADYFKTQKEAKPFFSHRYFAQKAGFSTSNFMHLVITGKRNLTKQSLTKVALAMQLNKSESEYFENLVFFNQSDTIKEKNFYYEKVTARRKSAFIQKINRDQFDYYATWFHPVVREVASFKSGAMDEKDIAKKIRPRIPLSDVRKSLDLLVRLGFLKKKKGKYVQTTKLLTTGPEVASLAVVNYHVKTMALAADALERFRPENRDISSLTLGISKSNFLKIRKRLQEFRKEVLEMAQEEDPDRVYQLNFHLFPMTLPDS